jgi:hypothetical protein
MEDYIVKKNKFDLLSEIDSEIISEEEQYSNKFIKNNNNNDEENNQDDGNQDDGNQDDGNQDDGNQDDGNQDDGKFFKYFHIKYESDNENDNNINNKKYIKNIDDLDVIFNIISNYFNISYDASTYLYYRRRKSFPWKKKNSAKYLFWNAKFQNALISLDKVKDFNWKLLEFGKEYEYLQLHNIDIESQDTNLFRELNKNKFISKDGWNTICSNINIKLLKKIGLIPRMKKYK